MSIERLPDDPGLSVRADGPDHVQITVGDDWMRVSKFNARRVLAALSLLLDLPLTKAAAKSSKL